MPICPPNASTYITSSLYVIFWGKHCGLVCCHPVWTKVHFQLSSTFSSESYSISADIISTQADSYRVCDFTVAYIMHGFSFTFVIQWLHAPHHSAIFAESSNWLVSLCSECTQDWRRKLSRSSHVHVNVNSYKSFDDVVECRWASHAWVTTLYDC